MSRVSAGHTEGYIDAFASLYGEVASHLLARRDGKADDPGQAWFLTIADGLRGVLFIETVQASSCEGGTWMPLPAH